MLLALNVLLGLLFGLAGGTVFVWYWNWLIRQDELE